MAPASKRQRPRIRKNEPDELAGLLDSAIDRDQMMLSWAEKLEPSLRGSGGVCELEKIQTHAIENTDMIRTA